MRLLTRDERGKIVLTADKHERLPPYVILSHTWGSDADEVTLDELQNETAQSKAGYQKLQFCADQAKKDGISHFWIDTCCIDKPNHSELSEAITSMFRWYQDAVRCYVYLSDVSVTSHERISQHLWMPRFKDSRWFTRGWTLQELLAPRVVEFFSSDGIFLGSKNNLAQVICDITRLPIAAIQGVSLKTFPVSERIEWSSDRFTKRIEDKAYCMQGILDVFIPIMYGEGDNAWQRLKEEVAKRHSESTVVSQSMLEASNHLGNLEISTHKHWLVTRTPHPLFMGRETLIEELQLDIENALSNQQTNTPCRVVITGMGGQGKSELCLQVSRRLRNRFWAVMWVDVRSVDSAERDFLNLARKLSIHAQTTQDACLAISNLKHPWLLILDNADAMDIDYQDYFPEAAQGVIILTSRNIECEVYATIKSIALKELDEVTAKELLLKSATRNGRKPSNPSYEEAQEAQAIVSLLGAHALAITQAGAYISQGHCNMAEYPHIFKRRKLKLLQYSPRQARSPYGTVYATFEASAEAMSAGHVQAAGDALELLHLLAAGGNTHFPLYIFIEARRIARWAAPDAVDHSGFHGRVDYFTQWHTTYLPGFFDMTCSHWDTSRLNDAVSLLRSFSLITVEYTDNDGFVSMHPLIHAWARERQSDTDSFRSWIQTMCVLGFASQGRTLSDDQETGMHPHFGALIDSSKIYLAGRAAEKSVRFLKRALLYTGWYLSNERCDANLSLLVDALLKHMPLEDNDVSALSADYHALVARNSILRGDSFTAVHHLTTTVDIHRSIFDSEETFRLSSQTELAYAYTQEGRVEEAIALLEEVIVIQKQLLPFEDINLRASQQKLAAAYRMDGQFVKAISLLEEVILDMDRETSRKYRGRLSAEHDLAFTYLLNSQPDAAMTLLEGVVLVRKQTLAREHPALMASQKDLAMACKANGQLEKAILLLEEVVSIQKLSLSKEHPRRLESEYQLALAYRSNGQLDEAIALLEAVVKIEARTLAREDPRRLVSMQSLATCLWQQKADERPLEMMNEVVKIYSTIYHAEHSRRKVATNQLQRMKQQWKLESNGTKHLGSSK